MVVLWLQREEQGTLVDLNALAPSLVRPYRRTLCSPWIRMSATKQAVEPLLSEAQRGILSRFVGVSGLHATEISAALTNALLHAVLRSGRARSWKIEHCNAKVDVGLVQYRNECNTNTYRAIDVT